MPPSTQTASPPPFEPQRWHRIGGTADAWVFPITGKPTITNSSAYVVRTPGTVVVIDPGAEPEQAALVAETVLEVQRERERSFLLILTHAHLDHFLNIDHVIRACGRPLSFAHVEAVAAIVRKDRSHTLAILYKDARLPDWVPDVPLFATPAGTGAFVPRLRPGAELPHLRLELDPGNTLEIYATPGHSPCSCCVRLGEFIAIGDIQFAANPGLAGLAGWSAAALSGSLRTMSRLLSRGDIAVCGHGHGDCAPAASVARALERVQQRLGGLGSLAVLDERRVSSLRAFAAELLGESQRLFAILGGRLMYVSHVLDRIEEAEEAARIMALLDIDAIERVLGELGAFHQAFEAGRQPELAVVLKANAVVERLQRLIAGTPPLRSVCESLLGRIEQLLGDFGQTVQGLAFEAKRETVDLLDLVQSVAEREREASRNTGVLLDAADDADVFVAAMARAIAARSLLAVTPIVVECGPGGAAAAAVDAGRLRNLLTSLLELAAVGANGRPVEVSVASGADGTEVAIRCGRDDLAGSITPEQRQLYQRLMVEMGGGFGMGSSGFVLSIGAASAA